MNGSLLLASILRLIGDAASDQLDTTLFWVMIALWVIMPVFIVFEEFQERKALKEAAESNVTDA
ncbi:TPA: hypothetical protein HA344_03020 [Candidatus Bathyarchaeota archaeon]|jgi:RNAse (barnase) inhibitor barstar|nr:hypothetical protein [Candidatus Bathyarchaeota archaeon]